MKIYLLIFLTLIFAPEIFSQSQVEVITEKANLRGTPNQDGKVVTEVTLGEVFELIKQKETWFLVQTSEYVGWVHGNTIKLLKEENLKSTPYPAALKSQGTSSKSNRSYDPPAPTKPTTTYRTYIRGPRGGCYYINSNGNKTYVDKSLCN